MKRKMLSKYGVTLTEVENDEGEVAEKLVLGKRTWVSFGLERYGAIGLGFSAFAGAAAAAAAEKFLHADEGEQLTFFVPIFILCFLGFIAWAVARHDFQDFTSVKSELFYYKRVHSENLESPGSQLMLGMLVADGEFEYGVAQIPKEHNKFIEATLIPGSPGVIAAEEQEIRRADVDRG